MIRCCLFMSLVVCFSISSPFARGQASCPGGICPVNVGSSESRSRTPLAEHHEAVVRISVDRTGYAGSGVLIMVHENEGLVLTAAHVVENAEEATVRWSDGTTTRGYVSCRDSAADVAAIVVTPPEDHAMIPLASKDEWPPQGERVELVGYGGGRLRHWEATVNGYARTGGIDKFQTLSLNTRTISGDSGGAVLYQGRLVGVIWGGPLAGPRGPMTATHATCCLRIRTILGQCSPCWLEPSTPAPAADAPNNELLQQIASLQEQVEALRNQLESRAGASGEQGPRGPPGEPGRNGRDAAINIDELAAAVRSQISGSIRVRIEPVQP